MDIPIEGQLRSICREIARQERDNEAWAAVESDDEFQEEAFCGGYDADERAFCFSYCAGDNREYWFQFTLAEAISIAEGGAVELVGRPAEV